MKKRILASFVCFCLIIGLAACKQEQKKPDKEYGTDPPAVSQITSVTETVCDIDSSSAVRTANLKKTEDTPVTDGPSEHQESAVETPPKSETPKGNEDMPADDAYKEKEEQEEPKTDEPELKLVPQVPSATAQDNKKIAQVILDSINGYRNTNALKLEGLTEYAEYRSRQLVSNFAHDTKDERAAATALEYGEYVDPAKYGLDGEPYYTSCSREAIAMVGIVGTVDEVGAKIAQMIKNSASHWCYVGANEYAYIGVGVSYVSGIWYCDVAVATENTDLK